MRRNVGVAVVIAGCVVGCTKEKNLRPEASLSGPSAVRIDADASFDGGGSTDPDGRIVEWSFDFGDGSVPVLGASLAAHAWSAPGTYRVTLTVTDNSGSTAVTVREVAVSDNELPVAVLQAPAGGRVNRSIAFDASSSTDADGIIVDWEFDYGDLSNPEAGLAARQHVYSSAGTFAVSAMVTDDDGGTDVTSMQIAIADNLAPLASFSGPGGAIVGQAVAFDSGASTDSDGSIAARSWDFGDAGTSALTAPSHVYAAAGTFTVTLTVTDDEGKTATTTRQITVLSGAQANAAPTASFTSPASVREDRSAYFDAAASTAPGGSITSYAWNFGDGNNGTGVAIGHTYATPGTFVASLTITATYPDASTSTNTSTRSISVTANLPPSVALAGPTSVRVNRSVAFDASASADADGSIASFQFLVDGTPVVTSASPVFVTSFASAGTHSVSVVATDNDGATSTALRSLLVDPNAAPVASLSLPPGTRVNRPVTLDASASTDSDGGIISYAFDFTNDGTNDVTSGSPTAVFTYITAGTVTARVTVTDGDGATASALRTIAVAGNQAPSASFTGPTEGVVGATLSFDGGGSFDPDGTIASYGWAFGDATTATGAGVNKVYAAAGTFTVTLTVSDNEGGTNATTRSVTISSAAAAGTGPTTVLVVPSSVNVNQPVDFDGNASDGGTGTLTDWSFDFGDGSPVESGTARNRVHTYLTAGTRTATLTVTSTYSDGSTRTNTATRQVSAVARQVTIGSLTPSSGSRAGGEVVLITGSGFTDPDGTTVFFGGAPATILNVLDPTRMTVVSPVGDPGAADVTIVNANGIGFLGGAFTYLGAGNQADQAFCWVDASAGTSLGFAANDDDVNLGNAASALPFDFGFFGNEFAAGTQLRVTPNGWLSFSSQSSQFNPVGALPSASNPENLIAPFFIDQNVAAGSVNSLVTGAAPNRRFTLEWNGMADNFLFGDLYRYEVTLFEGSDDVKIQYRNPDYLDVLSDTLFPVIGIQDAARTSGLSLGDTPLGSGRRTGLAPGGRTVVFQRRNGAYALGTDTVLNVWDTDLPPGDRLPNGGAFTVRLSQSINTATATPNTASGPQAGRNGTVYVIDCTPSCAAGPLVPLAAPLSFNAAKDELSGVVPLGLIGGRVYRLVVSASVRDPLGRALSQDPMGVSCGLATPTDYTSDFLGQVSVAQRIATPGNAQDPRGIDLDAAGNRMFVASFNDDRVLEYSVATRALTSSVAIAGGANPDGLAVVGGANARAITADDGRDAGNRLNITVAPPTDLGELAFTDATVPHEVAVRPDGLRAYFAADNNRIASADLTGGGFALCDVNGGAGGNDLLLPSGGGPARGIAGRPGDATRYFAGNTSRFFVLNALACGSATGDTIAVNLNLGGGANVWDIAATSSFAWVTENGANRVRVVDVNPASGNFGQVVASVGLPGGSQPRGAALNPTGTILAVVLNGSDELSLIDTATNTELDLDLNPGNGVTRVDLGGACNPDDVAIVNNGGIDEYWVTCSGSNEVLVVR